MTFCKSYEHLVCQETLHKAVGCFSVDFVLLSNACVRVKTHIFVFALYSIPVSKGTKIIQIDQETGEL